MIQSHMRSLEHDSYFALVSKFYATHVILKAITRTRTLKGGGFGLTHYSTAPHFHPVMVSLASATTYFPMLFCLHVSSVASRASLW